jgi:hypothetical protein
MRRTRYKRRYIWRSRMYVKNACSQHNTSHVDSTPCSVTFSTLAGMQLDQQLPFPRPLARNKRNESWNELSRISERVHKQKMPSKTHGHFSRASACCSRRGEGRRLLNGKYYGNRQQKEQFPRPAKMPLRKEALGPWRQWSG